MKMIALRTDRWTRWHVLAACGMAALGMAATSNAWADIFHIAQQDEEYSHIFLVPLVAAWMLWVRRMRFRHCKPVGTLLGPIVIGIGWLISSFGFYHGHQSLWHGGSVMVVLGCILSVLGKHVLFRFFPAVAVMVFLIPVPGRLRQDIALPLQKQTAKVAQVALETFGVDAVQSENTLEINGNQLRIAEACNGVRGIFALMLVSYAFSFGLPLRNSVRILVLLASPLATIVCNVIRIVPTAWMYGYASENLATEFHEIAGWAMLPMAFGLLYGILAMLRWAMLPVNRYTLAQ